MRRVVVMVVVVEEARDEVDHALVGGQLEVADGGDLVHRASASSAGGEPDCRAGVQGRGCAVVALCPGDRVGAVG